MALFPGKRLVSRFLAAAQVAVVFWLIAPCRLLAGTGPSIITPPANQYVLPGHNATFTVTATGDAPLAYQWLENGFQVANFGRASGANSTTLTISDVSGIDAGVFQVVITNAWGAVTSSVANLTIATAHYVNANNPSPSAPYTTWATAATVIQNAVDSASVGDWIFVTNGTYNTGGKLVSGMK